MLTKHDAQRSGLAAGLDIYKTSARNKCRIKLFEVEGTEQKPIRFTSAGTKEDSRTKC